MDHLQVLVQIVIALEEEMVERTQVLAAVLECNGSGNSSISGGKGGSGIIMIRYRVSGEIICKQNYI